MKKRRSANVSTRIQDDYDFSRGKRGKHSKAYRAGHKVRVTRKDGNVEEQYFTLADGAVMIDPDLKKRFPNSEAVNRALRSILAK